MDFALVNKVYLSTMLADLIISFFFFFLYRKDMYAVVFFFKNATQSKG